MKKTDLQLKNDIEAELAWDPRVAAAQIGVTVNGGAVALLGEVDTYAGKWAAEEATKRVAGVRSVAQDLTVKVAAAHARSDADIAAAVLSCLRWNVVVPDSVTAAVRAGVVHLEGEVAWNFQRHAAEAALRHLMGVVAVSNGITLKPRASSDEVKDKVAAALQRQASADAKTIHVETHDGTVTLTGNASSWQSIADASQAAWSAAGVTNVVDLIQMT